MTDSEIFSALLDDVGRARDTCIKRGVNPKRIVGMVSYGAYRIIAKCAPVASQTFTLCGHVTIDGITMGIGSHEGIRWGLKISNGA